MRKDKKLRIVAIIALTISVVGLTLGFAAFSNTLTISSSATVSPDEADFDINVYGLEIRTNDTDVYDEESYKSTTTSAPLIDGNAKEKKPVKISNNGNSITISDISVDLIKPGDSITYNFIIKNEGQYDAYIDTSLFDKIFDGESIGCTPGPDATPELVENACRWIISSPMFMDPSGNHILSGETYELAKGDYILLDIMVLYVDNASVPRADGNFSVEFPDATIEFMSVPPSK